MNNKAIIGTVDEWVQRIQDRYATKQASALKAKDPTYAGQPDVPSCEEKKQRQNANLPDNPTSNMQAQDIDGTHGLCDVTTPSGTCQGKRPQVVDGNARDAAFKTPSTPISKIADTLKQAMEPRYGAQGVVDQFKMPSGMDNSLLHKMASMGSAIIATEEGKNLAENILRKQYGMQEAQNIITEVYNELLKESAAKQQYIDTMTRENNIEIIKQSHLSNLSKLPTELEKAAYMQGAMDGDQMTDPQAGPDQQVITDEQVAQAIQQLVESGAVSPEEVDAFLQTVMSDQVPQYSAQELAAMIMDSLQKGEITQEQADALSNEVLALLQQGAIPVAAGQGAM